MNRRFHILPAITIILLAGLLLFLTAPSIAASDPRVTRAVRDQLDARGRADVIIQLAQPDLTPAYALPNKAARGQWVYDTLRVAAEKSQGPLVAELERAGASYQRFWVVNAIRVQADAPLLARLLRYPQVQRVSANTPFHGVGPQPGAPISAQDAEAIPWGVSRVDAPWAWQQGNAGEGVVIAGQDTGYDWTHEALKRAYRGYNAATDTANHNYNWHDAIHELDPHHTAPNPCGLNSPEPCDDFGHGTHTMGTMAGNNSDATAAGWPQTADHPIGIAPGAKWIGCRNMENGWGRPSTYIECFQWLAAPWPAGGDAFTDGDPAKAPDVINDSWSCPATEGCTPEKLAAIEPALNAADAAGILVVVSAQNSGPSCSTIQDPPALYPKAFTVGATDSNDALANFSSRGPVTYNGVTRMGPDISGPGVSVFSSIPGNHYSILSGTSMAGPHVAGVAALLMSAEPTLKGRTDMMRAILTRTADPRTSSQGCGGDAPDAVPNNGFGWGIVNARSAIESLAQQAAIEGKLVDADGQPVSGVTVGAYRYSSGERVAQAVTTAAGLYHLTLPWGDYLVTSVEPGATGVAGPVYAVGGRTSAADLTLAQVHIFLPMALK